MAITFVRASTRYIKMAAGDTSLQNVTGSTLTAWIVPSSAGTAERFIVNISINGGTGARAYMTHRMDGLLRAGGRRLDADSLSAYDGSSTTTGTKYFVCAVNKYNGTATELYVNGAYVSALTVAGWTGSSSNTTATNFGIGGRGDSGSNPFDGVIDDVRVYSRALSAVEINNLYYANGRDNILYSLAHRYPMNEGTVGATASGTNATKDKCQGFNGTPTNSPTYAASLVSHRRRRR